MTITDRTWTWPEVAFRPRRFGHVNMYVGDLKASRRFYHDLLGLADAFDEHGLEAWFLSNGNSHHDVALMQASERVLVGRDGLEQKAQDRGSRPELNHIAFEMPTERLLVEGIRRAEAADVRVHRYYDHQISRSVYLPDPDGIEVEIYSDSTPDWRELFEELGDELLSARWQPGVDEPSDAHNYVTELEHRPVPDAPVQPLRTANATVVVPDLDRTVAFYERVVGLAVLESDLGAGRWAVLSGTVGLPDLMVLEQRGDQALGFHHFGLELADAEAVDRAADRLADHGIPIAHRITNARKRSIVVLDPDRVPVELFAAAPGWDTVTYAEVAADTEREHLL